MIEDDELLRLVRDHSFTLSNWNDKFLTSLEDWYAKHGCLTDGQSRVLRRIAIHFDLIPCVPKEPFKPETPWE